MPILLCIPHIVLIRAVIRLILKEFLHVICGLAGAISRIHPGWAFRFNNIQWNWMDSSQAALAAETTETAKTTKTAKNHSRIVRNRKKTKDEIIVNLFVQKQFMFFQRLQHTKSGKTWKNPNPNRAQRRAERHTSKITYFFLQCHRWIINILYVCMETWRCDFWVCWTGRPHKIVCSCLWPETMRRMDHSHSYFHWNVKTISCDLSSVCYVVPHHTHHTTHNSHSSSLYLLW